MPSKRTRQRALRDKRQGKAPSTQAGEFVREEIHHVRQGKHGARSTQQAIAIGLSMARRAGVKLRPPEPGVRRPFGWIGARLETALARDQSRPGTGRTRGDLAPDAGATDSASFQAS
jgi:hypothetical protein